MMTGLIIESSRDLAFFYYLAVMAGIAGGFLLAWAWRRDNVSRDDLRAEWQAMKATERLSEAAWDARQQMHQAAADQRRP